MDAAEVTSNPVQAVSLESTRQGSSTRGDGVATGVIASSRPRLSSMSVAGFASEEPLRGSSRSCSTARSVAVISLLCIVAGAIAIIMVIHESTHTKLTVPNNFQARFVASPRVSDSSRSGYETVSGSVHKVTHADGSWTVTGQLATVTHGSEVTTVTAVNGRVYVVVTDRNSNRTLSQYCMPEAGALELDGLDAALSNAAAVDTTMLQPYAGEVDQCAGHYTWLVAHQQQSYVVCFTNAAKTSMRLIGAAFVGSVEDMDTSPPLETPFTVPINVTSNLPMQCPAVNSIPVFRGSGGHARSLWPWTSPPPTTTFPPMQDPEDVIVGTYYGDASYTGNGRRLTSGGVDANDPRQLLAAAASMSKRQPSSLRPADQASSTRSLASGKGHHGGLSTGTPKQLNPEGEYVTWFHVDDRKQRYDCVFVHGAGVDAPYEKRGYFVEYWGDTDLKSHVFVTMPTVENTWESPALQQHFCSVAAPYGLVRKTVVFSHGMGTLIVAAALENNRCGFDFSNSFWLDLQPAYPLARITEFGHVFCEIYKDYPDHPMMMALQADQHLCVAENVVAPSWLSMAYNYPGLSTLADLIKTSVSGTMCGFYAPGLMGSAYADVLDSPWAPDAIIATSPTWSQCWDKDYASSFQSFPSAAQYMAAVNFLDVTCRNGDGYASDAKMPCFWMDAMVHLAAEADDD